MLILPGESGCRCWREAGNVLMRQQHHTDDDGGEPRGTMLTREQPELFNFVQLGELSSARQALGRGRCGSRQRRNIESASSETSLSTGSHSPCVDAVEASAA